MVPNWWPVMFWSSRHYPGGGLLGPATFSWLGGCRTKSSDEPGWLSSHTASQSGSSWGATGSRVRSDKLWWFCKVSTRFPCLLFSFKCSYRCVSEQNMPVFFALTPCFCVFHALFTSLVRILFCGLFPFFLHTLTCIGSNSASSCPPIKEASVLPSLYAMQPSSTRH